MALHGLRASAMISAMLLILSLSLSSTPVAGAILGHEWQATNFCKCTCFASNYTILQLVNVDNPSQPCLSCTKQWCINQNLAICAGASVGETDPDVGTGKEGDVEAKCFQRDSPRDQLVVTLYLLIVFGLVLGAGIKGRMAKAGIDTSLPWNAGRKWWEAWFPRRDTDNIRLGGPGRTSSSRSRDSRWRNGDYVGVSDDPSEQ